MIISPLPWSLKSHPNSNCSSMVDANGSVVALFADYRNADAVLEWIKALAEKEEELERLNAEFNITEDDLKGEIRELKAQLEKIQNDK